MKRCTRGILAALVFSGTVSSQTVVIPANPEKFKTRPIGGGAAGGVEVLPRNGATTRKVRYTTHIVLSVTRLWTSNDDKLLEGKLIAFEDMVAEATEGAAPPPTPEPPAHPTVVRNDKVRLLIGQKPAEVALDRLSPGDREFIGQVRKAYEKKPLPE